MPVLRLHVKLALFRKVSILVPFLIFEPISRGQNHACLKAEQQLKTGHMNARTLARHDNHVNEVLLPSSYCWEDYLPTYIRSSTNACI
jgi:hypothetical protein